MTSKLSILVILVLVVAVLPLSVASAQTTPALNLPPGIEELAQPYLEVMMQHMQQMGMSPEQMQMIMADMQSMADQLPPGIFLQILQWMPQLDMSNMLALHQQMQQGDLLEQPPGQILLIIQGLVGS